MKIRKIAGISSIALALAAPLSAQDFFLPATADDGAEATAVETADPTPAAESPLPAYTAPAEAAPAPAPVVKEPAAIDAEQTGDRAKMGQLRGNAYGATTMRNVAAPMSVDRALSWPHTMANVNMGYVEPANKSGVASYGMGSTSALLSLRNMDETNGLTSFGLASTGWGLMLQLGLEKEWHSRKGYPDGDRRTTAITERGDFLGAVASFPIGDLSLALNTGWLTHRADTTTSQKRQGYYDLTAGVALSNYQNGSDALLWEFALNAGRHEIVQYIKNNAGVESTIGNPNAHFGLLFSANLGSKVLAKDDARLFVGLNNSLWASAFDRITNEVKHHYEGGVNVAPNIVGELALGKYWIAYAGLSHSISYETAYRTDMNQTATGDDDVTIGDSWLLTSSTQASTGVRFATSRFALEASVADQLYSDGVSALFSTNGGGLVGSFGAMVLF